MARQTSADIEAGTTLDEHERAELKNPGYELFVAALSVLSIVNLGLIYVVRNESLDYILMAVNLVLSVVLFFDFLVRFFTAESKAAYFWRGFGWADLLASLPLAQLKVLRVFRLARVYRLLKEYGARNVARSLLVDRAGSALYTLLLIAILVLEFGSLGMLGIEGEVPDGNIRTASDALWYVIVTISTVGYGDRFPVTNAGRVLGALIIVVGVGIFGTLTGYLANIFLAPSRGSDEPEAAGPDDAAADAGDHPADDIDVALARLSRLDALRTSGLLTEDEARATKERILAGAPGADGPAAPE